MSEINFLIIVGLPVSVSQNAQTTSEETIGQSQEEYEPISEIFYVKK